MASPKQSQGVGPPDPTDIAALQPKRLPHGEREGAVAPAPGPATCVATVASGLWCKAFLVLAICLSVVALPYNLGSLAALPEAHPGSPPPSHTWMCSPASQQGPGDDLVATHRDLLEELQQSGKVLLGSMGTSGSILGTEEDVTHDTDGEGWSLGTPTTVTASPSTAWTSPQQQPSFSHGKELEVSTTVAVTQWLGTRVPAASAQLLQTMDDLSPGSQHPLTLGRLHGTGPGLHDAVQVTEVTLSPDLAQPMDMAQPYSPGAHVSSRAPACTGTVTETLPQNHSTADQLGGDQRLALVSSPDHQTMPYRADLSLAVSSKLPDVVTTSNLPSWTRPVTAAQVPSSVPASSQYIASSFSDVQHEAPVAGATRRRPSGQKEEVRPSPALPDLAVSEDHTTAAHPVPLPWVPSALPTERMSKSTKRHRGTVWVPSTVTAEMPWDTQPADTFLPGEAALMANAALAKAPGNGSGLLATVLASLPSTALAHDVNHHRVLAPFLPSAEAQGPAVSSGIPSDLSSPSAQQTLPTPTKAHPSPAWTRAPSTVGPTVRGASSEASDAIPEPEATKVPCKDGAALVASPSPRAVGVTHGFLLGSPTQGPPLHSELFLMTTSEHGPTAGQSQDMKVAETSVLPGQVAVAEDGHSKPGTTLVGPTAPPAGPPEPTYPSSGSVPPPSSKNPALECCSEAMGPTSTTSLPSPPYLLLAPGTVHAASSPPSSHTMAAPPAVTHTAQSMSSPFVTSQHPSTTRKHLPTSGGEAITPDELTTMGKPGSPGVQPSASHPFGLPSPAQPLPVQRLPLQFRLVGITYTEDLSSKASKSYRELEEEVRLMLNQMLSTYETFLQADVLEFRNGSVVVQGEALFQGDAPAPSNSHLIRTILTASSKGKNIFSWQLEPESVQSGGFSLENLDPEKLSISLTVIQLGRDRADSLERLSREVTQALSTLYKVRNFTLVHLRNLSGELEITGDIYLDTTVHADVAELLQALTALVTCSVDLTSISVEGAKLDLQVYPVSFLITNKHFSEDLLDPLAIKHQELTRNLSDVVAGVLRRDHRSFLQVVIRGFLPGSLICHGDVVFQHPAPSSLQVLEALVLAVGPNKALGGSDFQVDPFSLAVGEATLEPPQPEPGFPEYGVAIMVVCGLCIITAPIVLLVCLRTKRLHWWRRVAFWDRRDPEAGTQTLEMDNPRFWAPSEQVPLVPDDDPGQCQDLEIPLGGGCSEFSPPQSCEDAHTPWQNDSV